jgi:hypothetical protein
VLYTGNTHQANLEEVRVLADPVRQQLVTLAGTFGEQL